jgi:hypothetical protein
MRKCPKALVFLAVSLFAPVAAATSSAELYTTAAYGYGRVEARVRFAAGDGVVSSFFLWKSGSEQAGTFWNELDFEKVGADCRLETNPIYGNPSANHSQRHALDLALCDAFHTYAYEWTPDAIVWRVDGMEIRRETGATAQAFADNASAGMQLHFNLWPGDASFGGNFNPAILPVHEYLDWVQFSKYEGGAFTAAWREDFDGTSVPAGWATGNWASPKNKSTHSAQNVSFIDGFAVLSLTADDALGPAGAMPQDAGGTSSTAGASAGGSSSGTSGAVNAGGTPTTGSAGPPPAAGTTNATAPSAGSCSFGPAPGETSMLTGLAAWAFGGLLRSSARRRTAATRRRPQR